MLIENTQIFGFQVAFRAMRNPMDSWDRSDSSMGRDEGAGCEGFVPGPKDLELFLKLAKNGPEHGKQLRFIKIWVTLTLPRYVWTEFDTYKVGCERYSCSTMHKLGTRELTNEDFQSPPLPAVLDYLNGRGKLYRDDGKKDYDLVRDMKANMPESFLQKSDISMNYQTALNIFRQRRNHRLQEWRFTDGKGNSICDWIYRLPLMEEIVKVSLPE